MINPSLSLKFAGRSVLVTGGGSGIGAAVAQAFGAAGAQVAVHFSRNQDGAEAVAESIRKVGGTAITLGGDLQDRSVANTLLLRPEEVSSRITNPAILEVRDHALGGSVQHRHVFVGRFA